MATQTFSYETDATIAEIRGKVQAFMKGASDLTQQYITVMNLMRRWGTLMFNKDISWSTEWTAKVELPDVTEWADDVLPMFEPGPVPIKFNLEDGSYKASDKFTKMQEKRFKGNRTLIYDHYNEKSRDLVKSMRKKFNFELLHGTGTGRRITGLDVPLTLTGGTNVDADKVLLPGTAASYAGQTVRPGTIGGSWPATLTVKPNANLATDWPVIGNQTTYDPTMTKYDATSPLTLNTSSTSWENGSEWKNNCEEVMRYYISVQRQRGAEVADANSPLVALCGEQRLREARNYFSARNYALLPVQEAMDWGMPDTVNFEGMWLTTDAYVGSDFAYCIQPDMLEYITPDADLWETYGPEFKLQLLAYLYLLLAIGKLRIQSKFIGSLQNR